MKQIICTSIKPHSSNRNSFEERIYNILRTISPFVHQRKNMPTFIFIITTTSTLNINIRCIFHQSSHHTSIDGNVLSYIVYGSTMCTNTSTFTNAQSHYPNVCRPLNNIYGNVSIYFLCLTLARAFCHLTHFFWWYNPKPKPISIRVLSTSSQCLPLNFHAVFNK